MKNLRRIEPTESQIQMAIVEWANNISSPFIKRDLSFDNHKLGDFLIKNANDGKRSWFVGKKMKKEGLKKGVSDLFLAIPVKRTGHCGFWIEVKSKYGKTTKEQKDWLEIMESVGFKSVVIKSVDEGIQAIKDYLGMR